MRVFPCKNYFQLIRSNIICNNVLVDAPEWRLPLFEIHGLAHDFTFQPILTTGCFTTYPAQIIIKSTFNTA